MAGSLALVLQAGTPLKRVAKVLEMNWSWWGDGGAVGSYYSVRLWLLRLGLHQLQTHHERAEDWMWIVDHTMQLGEWKCLIIDVLVDWAETKLAVLENPDVQAASWLDSIVVEEKLGWLREYRSQVQQWREVMEVIGCTERYVRHHGIHRKASKELAVLLPNSTCDLASKFRQRLLEFVEAEAEQAESGERLLGSSEVLESIIGKYKCIAGERGQHGLTGLVLAIGALVGRMTVGTVQDALEQVTCQDARSWCQSHLGPTVQGLRQRITSALKSEQKQQTTIPGGG